MPRPGSPIGLRERSPTDSCATSWRVRARGLDLAPDLFSRGPGPSPRRGGGQPPSSRRGFPGVWDISLSVPTRPGRAVPGRATVERAPGATAAREIRIGGVAHGGHRAAHGLRRGERGGDPGLGRASVRPLPAVPAVDRRRLRPARRSGDRAASAHSRASACSTSAAASATRPCARGAGRPGRHRGRRRRRARFIEHAREAAAQARRRERRLRGRRRPDDGARGAVRPRVLALRHDVLRQPGCCDAQRAPLARARRRAGNGRVAAPRGQRLAVPGSDGSSRRSSAAPRSTTSRPAARDPSRWRTPTRPAT